MTVLTPGHLNARPLDPGTVRERVAAHMLADGFEFVLDLDRSHGSTLVDARDGSEYLDLFTFFASSALGMNHADARRRPGVPRRVRPPVAVNKPSNSDIYTVPMARFVRDLRPGARRPGAAAPVLHRRRRAGGRERAQDRLRLEVAAGTSSARHRPRARHQGAAPRTRLPRPHRVHDEPHQHRPEQGRALPEVRLAAHPVGRQPPDDNADVAAAEAEALAAARRAFEDNPHDIACFIMEPIQGEGGDNHFRP